MGKSVQYTMQRKQSITLSNLAKKWRLSRKLLFKIMEEKGILKATSQSKRLVNSKYGFTTQHVTRTAIYIYINEINQLFIELNLPSISEHQRMCYECREVKDAKDFRERMATCIDCKNKSLNKFKKDDNSLKKHKDGINPYFLRRGEK